MKTTAALLLSILGYAHAAQLPFRPTSAADEGPTATPPAGMVLHPLSISGPRDERVNLAFFADGYTAEEHDKFVSDATRLTADIVGDGPMSHVRDLLNVWGIFVPSKHSGLGNGKALPGAPFGLYREGTELRAVYAAHRWTARSACAYWADVADDGGCDQPILLGNDPLYGGLGGEFTIITASELNGPLVLRHELGHSLIPVGEEYEGGYVYSGVNSEPISHLHNLSWTPYLTHPDPAARRIEDVKVSLQAYPWHDLDAADYSVEFKPTEVPEGEAGYDSALLRMSLSSIPYPSHARVTIGPAAIDLTQAFPAGEWEGSKDRRWVEVPLPGGLPALLDDKSRPFNLTVSLTHEGSDAEAGQGGKMVTSIEIIEYGGDGRCNTTQGFVGAFPTYALDGGVTLRPMNEECIMRRVTHPTFCPPCAAQLRKSLEAKLFQRRVSRGLA